MAKVKGKRVKRKGKKLGSSNAKMKKVKAPLSCPTKAAAPDPPVLNPDATFSAASGPENKSNAGASPDNVKVDEISKHIFGFIFMCNSITKIECYQYRVFGLPSGQQEVVEQIKPGTKLFLFDFQSKVLYGVYEATSAGKMNLEPAAFQGRFPAQVKFKIFKECLPMPESFLRCVVNENYSGSKFNQVLSRNQVQKLLSAFCPLSAPSSQPASQALVNASQPHAMPPLAMENQCSRFTGRPPATETPSLYLPGMYHRLVPAFSQPQHISDVTLQHGLCSLPATSTYVTHGTQDTHYSRATGERAPQEGPSVSSSDMQYHQLSFHRPKPDTQYAPSIMQPQPHVNHGPPVQYTPSVMQSQPQPYVPVSYPQLPLQRERHDQASVTRYNYHVGGSATQHASFVAVAQPQPQPPPRALPAGASQGVALLSYYSHPAGNRLR